LEKLPRYFRICLAKLNDLYTMFTTPDLEKLKHFFSAQPVEKVFLFGSVARNEDLPDSDIDILIEIDENVRIGLVKFALMKLDLEEIFKRKVDLLAAGGVSKYILPNINQDKILVYEKRVSG
jgi:uncharacterized protein